MRFPYTYVKHGFSVIDLAILQDVFMLGLFVAVYKLFVTV